MGAGLSDTAWISGSKQSLRQGEMLAERYGNVPKARYYDQCPHDPVGPVFHRLLAACLRMIASLRSANRCRPDPERTPQCTDHCVHAARRVLFRHPLVLSNSPNMPRFHEM